MESIHWTSYATAIGAIAAAFATGERFSFADFFNDVFKVRRQNPFGGVGRQINAIVFHT